MPIKLSDIKDSELNCRIEYLPDGIADLAEAIKSEGLNSRLVLRANSNKPGTYELLAGGRRLRALKSLRGDAGEINEYEFVVKDVDDFEALKTSLSENSQRASLSVMELTTAASKLKQEKPSIKISEIAKILWIPEAQAKRLLSLRGDVAELPGFVKEELMQPLELQPLFNDNHWEAIKKGTEDKELPEHAISDICRYVMDNELPASRVDVAIKKILRDDKKEEMAAVEHTVEEDNNPFKEKYKGVIVKGDDGGYGVRAKNNSITELPLDQIREFIEASDQFDVHVTMTVEVKIKEVSFS